MGFRLARAVVLWLLRNSPEAIGIEWASGSSACNEAEEEDEYHSADNGDEDGVQHAAR